MVLDQAANFEFTHSDTLLQESAMNQTLEAQIADAEERLRIAMLEADVTTLNSLLAPDLIFTNHLGQLLSKEDDLAAHRSGLLKIEKLKLSEQRILFKGETAIVSVRAELSGTYNLEPASGNFRFTRVWALSTLKTWQVIAAHACIVSSSQN
jgi:ketosteroid isomerase-like protein